MVLDVTYFGPTQTCCEHNVRAKENNEETLRIRRHLDSKHIPSHRVAPPPCTSGISVRGGISLSPSPSLSDIIEVCKHWTNKGAGRYDAQSLASRCLYHLGKEVMEIVEELHTVMTAKEERMRMLEKEVEHWQKQAMGVATSAFASMKGSKSGGGEAKTTQYKNGEQQNKRAPACTACAQRVYEYCRQFEAAVDEAHRVQKESRRAEVRRMNEELAQVAAEREEMRKKAQHYKHLNEELTNRLASVHQACGSAGIVLPSDSANDESGEGESTSAFAHPFTAYSIQCTSSAQVSAEAAPSIVPYMNPSLPTSTQSTFMFSSSAKGETRGSRPRSAAAPSSRPLTATVRTPAQLKQALSEAEGQISQMSIMEAVLKGKVRDLEAELRNVRSSTSLSMSSSRGEVANLQERVRQLERELAIASVSRGAGRLL